MKRLSIILMAAAILAALSCTKEVNDPVAPETEKVTMSFDATIGVPTKTELGEANGTGYKVLWSSGDKIAVFTSDPEATTGSTQKVEFSTDITSASAQATFTGEIKASDVYYAVYPYEYASYWSEKYDNVTVELPASQTPNGIASGISVATANENTLQFEHVTGYVKFTIPDTYTDIKEVRFSGNNSETLAGQFYVYRDNGETANKAGNTKYSELTLTPSSGEVFAPGTYYFTSYPAELTKGITLTFVNSNDEEASKSTDSSKPATIKAGDILNLGTIDGLSFAAVTPAIADGTYAVLVKHEEEFFYLTNVDMGASTKRLRADNSELSELPVNLGAINPAYVWNFTCISGSEFTMQDNAENYISHTSGNSAYLGNTGLNVLISKNGENTYSLQIKDEEDVDRYLSMSNTGGYFVFYKSGVSSAIYDIYLIPATADEEAKITSVITNDPTGITETGGVLNASYDGYNLINENITVGFMVGESSYTATLGENNTFSYNIDGLTVDETYEYKAWASIDGGTSKIYGEVKSITPQKAVPTSSVTINLATAATENGIDITNLSSGPITLTFAKSEGNNAPKWYTAAGGSTRMYNNNTLEISGGVIRKIEMTSSDSSYYKTFTSSSGTVADAAPVFTWEGNSENVVLTATGTGRWIEIKVTYETSE